VYIAGEVVLRDTHHQDGFFVVDDMNPAELALEIQAHQGPDGLAGIGRDAHHLIGEEHIAQAGSVLIDPYRPL
jgi:hypothetical protein